MNLRSVGFVATMLVATMAVKSAAAYAAETVSVSARDLIKTERFEILHQDDGRGRLVYTARNRGVLRETTKSGLLDGVTKVCTARADLINGSGSIDGYCLHEQGESTVNVQWSGMCHTSTAPDGKVHTGCWGGWIYLPGGKGRYASVSGGGTWQGRMTPSGEFDEEIAGVVTR
jgi:hypothetical protein